MSAWRRSPSAWLAVVWLLTAAASASGGQAAGTATVTGTVRDQSEAVVPGATVEIRNPDTNQVWRTYTDERGRFRLGPLPVGDYHLSAVLMGFTTANANLRLAVADAPDVPIVLRPSAVTEAVIVEAPAPLVEARRTAMTSAVSPHEIDTLPLNGRNYLDLALLAPNVSRTNTRSNERFAETSAVPGTGLSVGSQRNLANTFVVDGLSANDDAADLAGASFSEEVIREFAVVSSGGVAEFGRASSGTISVVTQSGTNSPRGRIYEFYRDDALDARNALATREDPLSQHQFGATGSGPIVSDRIFWFGNVERTLQDRTGIVTIAPSATAAVNRRLDDTSYGGPRVATGEFPTGYHTTNLFGRVDSGSGSSRLETRFSYYDVTSQNARGAGGLNDVSRGTWLDDRDHTVAASYVRVFGSGSVNEARAQWTRSRLSAGVNDAVGPAVNIAGVANWGTSTSSPTARDLDVFEAVDAVTLARGTHLIKAGVDALLNRATVVFPGALQGVYTFSSLAAFERGAYVNFQQAFGATSQFQSNPNLGAFVQDEWRPGGGLTINAGMRYDLQWLPSPVQLDTNNVSPRIGVAYAAPDGRTVVRASGGLYFDRIPLRATSNALQRDGTKYQVAVLVPGQVGAPRFPAVLPSFPAGVLVSTTTINPAIEDPYSLQTGLEVERAIGTGVSATVGYTYLRGRQLIMSHNINVPTWSAAQAAALGVTNLGRPNPDFGNISQYDSLGDSWYHGLTLGVALRPSSWGSARVSYTVSSALDDAGNAFFSSPQDNFDILADKGPSDNDQRHRVVVSGTVDRLRPFHIGYVWSFATGVPFNPVTGTDRNNDTNNNDRPAGVGRNSARQPSTSSFDVRLSRAFALPRGHRLEAMIEAFNVLNHVNVIQVNNTFGPGPVPLPTYGQPTAAADPRQIQLGVRWSF